MGRCPFVPARVTIIRRLCQAVGLLAATGTVVAVVGLATAQPSAAFNPAPLAAKADAVAIRCHQPYATAGTTITVDAHGAATSPAQPGRDDFICVGLGTWETYVLVPDSGVQQTCPPADLGHMAVLALEGTNQTFAARCDADGPVGVWDAV